MVYTLVYKDALIPIDNDGYYTFYKGRVVWETKDALYTFMKLMSFTKPDYFIYEIVANWHNDTIESHSVRWKKLNGNFKGKRI